MPHRSLIRLGLALLCLFFAACGSATTSGIASDGDAGAGGASDGAALDGATTNGASATDAAAVQLTLMSLPLGDGKYGPAPKRGHIYSCQQSFMGGGAFKDGPWIKSDGTFDFTSKVVVQGMNAWPSHAFAATISGATREVTSNGLPNHVTGTYP